MEERENGNGGRPPRGGAPKPSGGAGDGSSFFDRYKPEQGTKVRGYSMLAALVLAAGAAQFLYRGLAGYRDPSKSWTQVLVLGAPTAVFLALGAAAFWAVYRNRTGSDFLIATEGEMRKVNWSSRREVIGSTKVVIAFTFLFAFMIGLVDLIFFRAFQWIGVLKEGVAGLGDPGG